ncbi:MAG TPA: FixH family protein [Polyangiaceae bacterium]|jgi:nitrogen fixation protein FixH|nr:FixH family protein [Polyangiaceae bacterium]
MTQVSARAGSGAFWAFLPVLLLAASLAGVGTMATIAARDPSFSLERDYYDRAVHWDREQAQAAENQRLGYQLSLRVSGPGEVEVSLADRQGGELRGAVLRAEAFSNARAANVQKLSFLEAADGTYRARIDAPRPGLWEFRFRVETQGQHFTQVVRADLPAGAAQP